LWVVDKTLFVVCSCIAVGVEVDNDVEVVVSEQSISFGLYVAHSVTANKAFGFVC